MLFLGAQGSRVSPPTGIRILHCPTNPAGQATAFRDAQRDLGAQADVLTYSRNAFGYSDDYCLDAQGLKWKEQRRRRLRAAVWAPLHYDVLHFHGTTIVRGTRDLDKSTDLALYRFARKTMLMTYWGSDARFYSIADSRNPYYRLMYDDPTAESTRRKRMQHMARFLPLATVPDIELREHVEQYFERVEVVPVIVRTKDVIPTCVENVAEPLIVHAPSKRKIKGTEFVLEAVDELKRRNVPFRFQLLENISNERVQDALAGADLVVDQLLLGICGMPGLEAMALGKPVVTYLREDLNGMYPDGFPAVHATKDTLADVLEGLLGDYSRRRELGMAGRRYVERHHSPEVLGTRLLELYGSL